jgi:hypothetical protein
VEHFDGRLELISWVGAGRTTAQADPAAALVGRA